ncbi:MAG: hypothetical protein F6K26_24965 [Moorea sp. SIO2I5]|nr:hypothetical protein [Moorena sp. SIO2I5]
MIIIAKIAICQALLLRDQSRAPITCGLDILNGLFFFAIAPYLIPMALPAKAALQQLKSEFISSGFGKASIIR